MRYSIYRRASGRSSSRRWPSKHQSVILMEWNANLPSSATPVPFGRGRGKPINVPDHPPPPGYLCYRCREKGILPSFFPLIEHSETDFWKQGHWIQACPTNNDPKFDGKYRVKRSTGIPRSLQTKVEKPEGLAPDGSSDDARNTGVMVNADGDFVIAKPDKAAWELYQEKVTASLAAAAEAAAAEERKVLQARGLECSMDKRMFLEPTKTPCCQRTYCNDCITNALIDSDFVCPGCSTEGVLIDNLIPDDEASSKIKAFEAEKAEAKKEKEKQPAGPEALPVTETSNQVPKDSSAPAEQDQSTHEPEDVSTQSKKRPAEDKTTSDGDGADPENAAKKLKGEDQGNAQEASTDAGVPFPQMPFGGFGGMPPFPNPGFGNDGMGLMNPMAMPNGFPNAMGPGWNPMNMPFNPLQPGMFGDQSTGFPNMFNGDPSMMFPMTQMPGSTPNPGFAGPGMNGFSNQQRTAFSGPYSREEDSAYFRQPVNPQRHQARNRRVRPSDYREL